MSAVMLLNIYHVINFQYWNWSSLNTITKTEIFFKLLSGEIVYACICGLIFKLVLFLFFISVHLNLLFSSFLPGEMNHNMNLFHCEDGMTHTVVTLQTLWSKQEHHIFSRTLELGLLKSPRWRWQEWVVILILMTMESYATPLLVSPLFTSYVYCELSIWYLVMFLTVPWYVLCLICLCQCQLSLSLSATFSLVLLLALSLSLNMYEIH